MLSQQRQVQSLKSTTIIVIVITLPSDALRQLDVIGSAGAAPIMIDAVLYNSALALIQGGAGGYIAAFTLLARCSHLQVSDA
jgi:hypothetical protein